MSRSQRVVMIMVPAAFASMITVAGCGASDSGVNITPPSAGLSSGTPASSTVAPGSAAVPPATSSAPLASGSADGSSGSGSSGYSAVLQMNDGQGDTFTENFTFGGVEKESDVSDVINGTQTCDLGVAIAARNLVVPVQITTTLTSSVQTQIPIGMYVSQYSAPDGAGIPADVIYQTTDGDQCETNQPGVEVTLGQGQSATSQAWILIQQAITPSHPNGDMAALGQDFVFLSLGGSNVTSAQGNAVCTGGSQSGQGFAPPYLIFAGNPPSGEGCTGQYTASSS